MLLLVCTCAYADVMLYRSSRSIGSAASYEEKGRIYIPAEDAGKLLGYVVRSTENQIELLRNNIVIRIIAGSSAAWRGKAIVPMQSVAVSREGRIWIDTNSAVNIFAERDRLRFVKMALTASKPDYGLFTEPEPEPEPVASSPAPVASPGLSRPIADDVASPGLSQPRAVTNAGLPAPVASPGLSRPRTVAQAPEPEPEPESEPITLTAPTKPQPKHQSYKPNDEQTGNSQSGTIQSIRWTDSGKRIRAVIVADDDADPEVFMQKGKLHALFSSSLESNKDLASPYEKVNAELKAGHELIFTAPEMLKADKTVLTNPRRIVIDFFFPEAETKPEPTQTVAEKDSQPEPEPAPKRADPIIIVNTPPRTENPAVKTLPSSITMQTVSTPSRKTIVIDPGHGGKDPGTSGNGAVEKDINLAIGQELARILQGQGYNVIMTRKTDIYLTLQERTDIANNANADVFVSIHVNALPRNPSTTGIEIYIMALPTDNDAMNLAKVENREYVEDKGVDIENVDRRTEMLLRILGDMQQNNKISESTEFASVLYNAGSINGLPMRRVAQAPFFVLRGAGMPAVLIETGFITNASEAGKLVSPEYQASIANAIARGIMSYKEMR